MMKVKIKKTMVILSIVCLFGIGGCGVNGTPLGTYNLDKKSTKNVTYTKYGKISGAAINSNQQYLSFNPWDRFTRIYNAPLNTYERTRSSNSTSDPTPGTATDFPNQSNNTPPPLAKQNYLMDTTQSDSASIQIVALVNQARINHGLRPLKSDPTLNKVANIKAEDLLKNNYFSHTSPTYGSPFQMMKTFGVTYKSAGENIAQSQTSPYKVMTDWMNSPSHRANILNKSYTQIGVGHSTSKNIWVQEFTGK